MKKKVILFYLFLLVVSTGFTQTMDTKSIVELKANQKLVNELNILIDKVDECDYFKTSLIWNIGISEAEGGCLYNITMQEQINMAYDYVGCFKIGDIKFVVSGIMDENLFQKQKNKKVEFVQKVNETEIIKSTPSGDYSNWIYFSKEKNFIFVKEYLIPCN